jgi:hypothetical protein
MGPELGNASLAAVHRARIDRDGTTIPNCHGLHRVATMAEVKQIVGPDLASSYRIISNDARARVPGNHS